MAYTDIDKPTDYFSTNLWVADDTSPRSFTGFGHQPDMVWTKHRGSANLYHTITDSVRGGDKMIAPNDTSAEDTKSHGEITSFNSDGITVADGTSGTYPKLYFNDLNPFGADGGNYVGWSWKAGGSASSNTDGSITSSVSANTTAGFSIVSYTGNGSAGATIGHGLNSAPSMLIVKRRNTTEGWQVFHTSLGNTKYIELNSTSASVTASTLWNNTSPSSSVVTFGTSTRVNASGSTYIAYCFAQKKGFSKFGSYTGNGSTDGTFTYLGFRPAFVLVKQSSASGEEWQLVDNKRNTYNPSNTALFPSSSVAENSGNDRFDFLSNGFKCRSTSAGVNSSGATYIYMCFSENPFVTSTGIPATAR